jgi:hypothetical protein
MAERKNPFRNIKLVFRPASPALKIAVCVLIVCCMAALIALTWVRASILDRTEQLREEAAGLESANAELEEKIGGDFSFFPDAPEKTKESFNISDWPGLSDVINDPLNPSFDLDQIFGY